VEVGVEHDGGERQKEHRVGPAKLSHGLRIALAVSLGKGLPPVTDK